MSASAKNIYRKIIDDICKYMLINTELLISGNYFNCALVISNVIILDDLHKYYLEVTKKVDKHQIPYDKAIAIDTINYLENNFKNAFLSINEIVEHCKVSSRFLQKTFKKHTGETINHYINKKRIDYAKNVVN